MGHMSARAKIMNMQPKKNSKSHKEKEAKRLALMSNKIVCEKCGNGNLTLHNKQGHYYCEKCK